MKKLGRRSRAMTLVELLVVLAIIGLLVALLLPAIQGAREAARRSRCASHLRQIGLGLLMYHDVHGSLPVGIAATNDPRHWGPHPPCTALLFDKSFLVSILPHVEQVPLYHAFNSSLHVTEAENRTILSTTVAIYLCPSDPGAGPGTLRPSPPLKAVFGEPTEPVAGSFTSYAGCHGSYPVLATPHPGNACKVPPAARTQSDGVLNTLAPMPLSAVRDGLGQTILVAERAAHVLNRRDDTLAGALGWWFMGGWGDTIFSTMTPVNEVHHDGGSSNFALMTGSWSMHPGGLNTLRCDGSVHFVTETVDSWPIVPGTGSPVGLSLADEAGTYWVGKARPGVWQALGTRAGGEALSDD